MQSELEIPLQQQEKDQKLISQELHMKGGQYIKSLVYGGMDGIFTSFAVVTASQGAELSLDIIVIIGIANIIADGFGMAVGDYLSYSTEIQYAHNERQREIYEFENMLDKEKQEVRDIFIKKGVAQDDAQDLTNILSKYQNVMVDYMMVEELGIIDKNYLFIQQMIISCIEQGSFGDKNQIFLQLFVKIIYYLKQYYFLQYQLNYINYIGIFQAKDVSPVLNGLVTFFSFLFFGIISLLPFILSKIFNLEQQSDPLYIYSHIMSAMALIVLGIFKNRYTIVSWYQSVLETMTLGFIVGLISFSIGNILKKYI